MMSDEDLVGYWLELDQRSRFASRHWRHWSRRSKWRFRQRLGWRGRHRMTRHRRLEWLNGRSKFQDRTWSERIGRHLEASWLHNIRCYCERSGNCPNSRSHPAHHSRPSSRKIRCLNKCAYQDQKIIRIWMTKLTFRINACKFSSDFKYQGF